MLSVRRYVLPGLSLILASLVFPIMFSTGAYAASQYDNAYNHVDQLKIVQSNYNGVTCDPLDITMTYQSYLNNSAKWYPTTSAFATTMQTYKDSFAQAQQTGSWTVGAVLVNDGSGGYTSIVRINWFEDDPGKLVFKGASPNTQVEYQSTTNTQGHYAFISTIDFARPYGSTDAGNCTPHVYAVGDFVANANEETYAVVSTEGAFSWAPTSSSEMGHWANLFATSTNVQYPTGYEGAAISATPPTATYVAMGDSFSSGEGNPAFEYGTDTSTNKCHRSQQAYPRLLQNDSSLNLGSTAFVACSGATTANVLSGGTTEGNWGEGPQVDVLSSDTDVVTITIGGNDIKFAEFAHACLFGSCNSSSAEYQESWGIMTDLTRSDYLPSRLGSLFSDIAFHLWLNSSVKVYVVGYPYLMTQASWEDRGLGICSDFDEDEATAAEAIVLKLNTVIEAAVTDFDNSRFVYVDPLATGSPFLGHELCRNGSYFNGIEASGTLGGDDAYVFHPNADGQQAYADLIRSYMS